MRKDLKHSTSIFCKSNNENDPSNEISFKISLILASKMKPFSEGEIAKECLEAFAEVSCPVKLSLVRKIP